MATTRLLLPALAITTALALALAAAATYPRPQTAPLIVHEWGTFTSLQDESGQSLGGINTDDEPVPSFVHNTYAPLIASDSQLPPSLAAGPKGIISQCLPDITMRLETPVLYFHLPPDAKPIQINVDVAFHGGWLSQFYPDALASAPGLGLGAPISQLTSQTTDNLQWHDLQAANNIGPLTAKTTGTLQWHNLQVNTKNISGPYTSDPVWTAPRNVASNPLTALSPSTKNPEHEQFLFYRGVGHLDSPIRVLRQSDSLQFRSNLAQPMRVPAAWLADIRPDNSLAFRSVGAISLTANPADIAAQTAATFDNADFSPGNMADLRAALDKALQTEGMNPDEAAALLNTWQNSYFKSPGLRLLYIVPQLWTDQTLPLTITGTSSVTVRRAMVGRIDIVTPQQRALVSQIAAGPFGGADWIAAATKSLATQDATFAAQLRAGRVPLAALSVPVPSDYAAYLALGRFRQALLLDALSHHPTPALSEFTKAYNLTPYHSPD